MRDQRQAAATLNLHVSYYVTSFFPLLFDSVCTCGLTAEASEDNITYVTLLIRVSQQHSVCLKVWFVMIVLFSFSQCITGIIPGPSHFQTKRLRFYVSEHNKNVLILTKY